MRAAWFESLTGLQGVVALSRKPSFEPSGKLAEDTNTYKGIVIKYNEPPEAKLPKIRWRLYPFKGEADLPVVYIHRQSAYLIGRDRKIADFPTDHPSCLKQHAVLQAHGKKPPENKLSELDTIEEISEKEEESLYKANIVYSKLDETKSEKQNFDTGLRKLSRS
ncbi:smad nuclear interacting protein 1 [Ditylenchus destructor]|nr:smad nuclear interacting protein 1 [Ditylenchus destructor]